MIGTAAPRTVTHGLAQREAATLLGAFGLYSRFAVPRILVATLLLFAPIRLWLGDWSGWDLFIAAAVAIYWPFQEWWMHLAVLHIRPRTVMGIRIDPWFAKVHRWHHRHPDVLERVFLPTSLILVLTPIHWALWTLITPTWALTATGIWCFTLAALIYEWVHYLVHTPYRPRTRWFTRVRRNHLLHHFKNERYWYAFTVPLVDTCMRTDPEPSTVPQSESCRTLEDRAEGQSSNPGGTQSSSSTG